MKGTGHETSNNRRMSETFRRIWNADSCQGTLSCGRAENSRLEEKLQSAQKSAAVWKQRYESLKEQARPYLEAVKLAPEKVRAFIDAILTRTRQTRQHDQPSRRKSQNMEL